MDIINKDQHLLKAIVKIMDKSLFSAFFNTVNIIDGTTEPLEIFGKTKDFALVDISDDYDESSGILREGFHEAYDKWEELKDK